MARRHGKIWRVAVGLVIPLALRAATVDVPETWDSGGVEGWSGADALNGYSSFGLSNPGSYLRLALGEQPFPYPQVLMMRADANSSGGSFAGDYKKAGAIRAVFKMRCSTCLPGEAMLCFSGSASGRKWFYPISASVLQVGKWVTISIPLAYSAGWSSFADPSETAFAADISDVSWIGVRILRNASGAQEYGLDDFVLTSRYWDGDGDGVPDYDENQVHPDDPSGGDSGFRMVGMSEQNGIAIWWPSSAGETYEVWRTADVSAGFGTEPFAVVQGAQGADMTVFMDTTVSKAEKGPYFYRVVLKDPSP